MYMHRKLERMTRLVAENELIGRWDVVPGVSPKDVTLPGLSEPVPKECVGDLEVMDTHKGPVLIPAKPIMATPLRLQLVDFQVVVPDRKFIEGRLQTQIAKSISTVDPGLARIMTRTLKVGLHNGHTVLGGAWTSYPLDDDDDHDYDVLRTRSRSIQVNGFVPHEYMALVVMVEYEIGLPINDETNQATDKIPSSAVRQGMLVAPVCLGATAFIPFDGKEMVLRGAGEKNVYMAADMLELKLQRDGLCAALTPKIIFHNDADGDDDNTSHVVAGFMMKAFDSIQGELMHGDVAPVPMPMGAGGTDFADDTSSLGGSERGNVDARDAAAKRRERPVPSARESTGTRTRFDSRYDDNGDLDSLAGSIVGGDSVASSLRLDPTYYSSQPRRETGGRFDRSLDGYDDTDADPLFVSNKNSLLARTMGAKLTTGPSGKLARGPTAEVLDATPNDVPTSAALGGMGATATYRAASAGGAGGAVATTAAPHTREMTRGTRSRLNRHGFEGAMCGPDRLADDRADTRGVEATFRASQRHAGAVVDIELEASDSLSCHDISIQFAGYRSGPGTDRSRTNVDNFPRPRCVYLSYQFYSCAPTRTETMRLLPTRDGEVAVLAREDAATRDETPLLLRYPVDTSVGSPTESREFAEYLAKESLCIEVWDADASLLLGTAVLPLKRLMRQRNSVAKCAVEVDVVDSECDAQTHGGVTSIVLSNGGQPNGLVVGSLSVVLANHGHDGRARMEAKRGDDDDAPDTHMGLNWRALGVVGAGAKGRNGRRAKTQVRARPLSEGAPELNKALTEHRSSARGASMRSLTSGRADDNAHTLNYDEVVTLFHRFKGSVTGTVQYTGDMMRLMDIPSWPVVTRKMIKAFKRVSGRGRDVEEELSSRAGPHGTVGAPDVNEFMHSMIEAAGMRVTTEECLIVGANLAREGVELTPRRIVAWLSDEIDRQDWALVGKKLRQASQRASLVGLDVEQMLSDHDTDGDGFVSTNEFKPFLESLCMHVKLSSKEMNMIVKHFSRRPAKGQDYRDPISLRDVMAFLGKEYVGNLNVRLCQALQQGGRRSAADILAHLKGVKTSRVGSFSYDEMESALSAFGVYETLSHEQVRSVIAKADEHDAGAVSAGDFVKSLGMGGGGGGGGGADADMDAESLLRMVVERAQAAGHDIDETFRHFDADGDGTLTLEELEDGLASLKIFDNIPNWRAQLPGIVAKFDNDNDGTISMREFLGHMGVQDYSPNIIQRMTKMFITASAQLSMGQIFSELDSVGTGELTPDQLRVGMGRFNQDMTDVDATSVVDTVSGSRGKPVITKADFVHFFGNKVLLISHHRLDQD
jgi:Ca2+-binding EF-hand superfamily protein